MTIRLRAILALLILVCAAERAQANLLFADEREMLTASQANSFRTWTVENADGETFEVRQVHSSVNAAFDVSEDVTLVLSTGGGWSDDRAAERFRVDGLGDTKTKLFYHAFDRRVLLSLGANLPTGSTALTNDELSALQSVQATALGFRQREYGRGFDVDLGVASGIEIGTGLTLGGGLGYLFHGEYDLDENASFQPGAEFTVTAGLDFRRLWWSLAADLVYRVYGTDQYDGADWSDEGGQFEFGLRAMARGEKAGIDVILRNVSKSDNELILEGIDLTGVPVTETRIENGNTFVLAAIPRYDVSRYFAGKVLFDMIAASQSQQQQSGTWTAGFGLGFEVRLTDYSILDIRGQKLTGSASDADIDLSGWDAAVAVRWQY